MEALKAKDLPRLSAIRMLNSALKNEAINLLKQELTDEEAVKIIKSEIKKRKDSIESYARGNRADLAAKEQAEIDLFLKYLPAQLSEEEINKKVEEILTGMAEADKINFGKVMGQVMKAVGQNADGVLVKKMLEDKLKK